MAWGERREAINAMAWQKTSGPAKPAALLGIFDFSYQHYALGDLLTNQVNLAIMAAEQGLRHVDIIVMVNPERPSARQQTFVTRANYIAHLDNVMPVFACNPLLRSLQLVRDVQTFNFMVALHHRNQAPMWPDLIPISRCGRISRSIIAASMPFMRVMVIFRGFRLREVMRRGRAVFTRPSWTGGHSSSLIRVRVR